MLATRMNLSTSCAVCGSRSTKHFWLLRMVVRITSGGIDQERAGRTRPSAPPAIRPGPATSSSSAFVLDQLEPLREREVLGVGEDLLLAPLGIEHDLGLVELRHVVVEAASPRSRRARGSGGRAWCCRPRCPRPANGTTSGSSVSGPNVATIECSGRTQRSAPGLPSAPQRIDFGHGKVRITTGSISAAPRSPAGPASRSARGRSRPSSGPSGSSPRRSRRARRS